MISELPLYRCLAAGCGIRNTNWYKSMSKSMSEPRFKSHPTDCFLQIISDLLIGMELKFGGLREL
jgi:hypothetical protein